VVGTWLAPGAEPDPGVTWTCEAEFVALGEVVGGKGAMTWLAVFGGVAEEAPVGDVGALVPVVAVEAVLEPLTLA